MGVSLRFTIGRPRRQFHVAPPGVFEGPIAPVEWAILPVILAQVAGDVGLGQFDAEVERVGRFARVELIDKQSDEAEGFSIEF